MMLFQVHIVQRGAVRPLIEMLQSLDAQLKEMSAFALGRLAQVMNVKSFESYEFHINFIFPLYVPLRQPLFRYPE